MGVLPHNCVPAVSKHLAALQATSRPSSHFVSLTYCTLLPIRNEFQKLCFKICFLNCLVIKVIGLRSGKYFRTYSLGRIEHHEPIKMASILLKYFKKFHIVENPAHSNAERRQSTANKLVGILAGECFSSCFDVGEIIHCAGNCRIREQMF
jgi:hypothetical protein